MRAIGPRYGAHVGGYAAAAAAAAAVVRFVVTVFGVSLGVWRRLMCWRLGNCTVCSFMSDDERCGMIK